MPKKTTSASPRYYRRWQPDGRLSFIAWYRQITSTSKIDTAKQDTSITNSAQYYKAGAVNLASYEKIHVNLCLVSVNQADVPNAAYIQEELNKIYAPAIVDFTVTTLTGGLTVELS